MCKLPNCLLPKKQPSVDKGKNKEAAAPEVSLEDLDEDECQGQGNDFSSYHLHTSDESDVDVDAKQSVSESLYDVDENIDDLSDLDSEFVEARKSNIQEQVNKEKAARINVDEIPSGPKNGYTTGTARTATGGSGGATTSAASTGVTGGATGGATTKRPTTTSATSGGATTGGNGGATTSAASIGVTTGGSGGATTKRPTTTSAASGGATTAATTTGGRAANISLNFASVAQPTSQFSTQQSTTSASGSNKSSKVKRGGANPGYKRPRTEKPRTAGFGVLFGANGSVIERSATTDKVLHCAPLKSSVPTNIDLGYKPNGLRWKGGAAVTQRQLQEQSYKRATQSTPSTQDT
uniref:Transposon MuDR mudrA n=1 Tax=Solanum tuberosum TaxID=4113 RepID=M1C228_SOLTU